LYVLYFLWQAERADQAVNADGALGAEEEWETDDEVDEIEDGIQGNELLTTECMACSQSAHYVLQCSVTEIMKGIAEPMNIWAY
jgi:hypothetical protein